MVARHYKSADFWLWADLPMDQDSDNTTLDNTSLAINSRAFYNLELHTDDVSKSILKSQKNYRW